MSSENLRLASGKIKREILLWVILIVPFIYIPFIWNKLPESIPTHWNIHGEPDDYSSKELGVLIVPLTNIGIYLLFLLLPKIDPRKLNYGGFEKTYYAIRLLTALFLTGLFFIVMQWSQGYKPISSKVIFYSLFGLLGVMGYLMPSIKSNFFIGIRTPWTLDNAEVWERTHAKTGKLWLFASIAALIISFSINEIWMSWLLVPYIAVIGIFPVVYSYYLYNKISKGAREK